MATITATSTNNWATAFPSVPTAADDVVIPSPYTVTIPSGYTAVCRSITVNSGGGWTIANSSTARINIGDGTAGAGNVAMSLDAGGSYNLTSGGGSGIITFISTSATQQTITTGGAALPTVTVNGSGSSYILGSAISWYATKNFTLTAGTFNTGNYSMSGAVLDLSGSTTRTFTPGSSTITLASSSTPLAVTGTNLTITSNTATIVATGTNPRLNSTLNMNGTSLTFSGNGIYSIGAGGTWNNITFTGGTDGLSLEGSLTATGTFTATGSSAANRIYVQSNTLGTARTFTAAAVSLTNVDFMDITGAGAASWTGTTLGDRQGNSGITFTTPATQTRDSTSGSAWSVAARWTSRVPLPQDNVVINGSSGNISSTDVSVWGKDIDFTGYTGTITHTSSSANYQIYGSLTLGSGMSYGSSVNTFFMDFRGRGSHTITSNGKTLPPFNSNGNYYIYAPGGTYTLADALSFNTVLGIGNCGLTVANGTFNSAGYNMTIGRFISTGTATRSVTLGSSVVTLYCNTATVMLSLATTGLTWSASSATFTISTATGNARSIDLSGLTIGTLNYNVANSPGGLASSSSCTINTLNMGTGRSLVIANSTTLTTLGGTLSGTNNGYIYLASTSSAYASVPDSAAVSWTSDFDLRARVAPDAWNQTNMHLAGKATSSTSQASWGWVFNAASKQMQLQVSSTGTSFGATATSSAAVGLSDGVAGWVRVTWRASDGQTKFYTSSDSTNDPSSVTWSQLGTNQTANVGSIYNGTAPLAIGASNTTNSPNFTGKYYRFQARNNILDDGTGIQVDADFTTKAFGVDTFTESSSNAATVTLNGIAAQGDGRLTISAGTFGYISKPYTDTLQTDYNVITNIRAYEALNWYAGANSINVSGNTGIIFSAYAGTYHHRQSIANYTGSLSTSISATFPVATTSGNLLVAYTESGNATGGGVTFTAGWIQAVVSTNGGSAYIWYKIADGTETTVTYSQTSSRVLTIGIIEYSGFSGTPTLDVTDNNNTGSSVTSLSTTATTGPTNSAQPALALAFAAGTSNLAAWVSATNSFVPDFTTGNQGGGNYIHTVVKELTTTAAVDTTIGWTTPRANVYTGLAVFKNVSTANGNFLVFMQ